MVAFEYLMVGVATYLGSVVHKACVQGLVDRYECDARLFVFEDSAQAVGLLHLFGEDIYLIAIACARA